MKNPVHEFETAFSRLIGSEYAIAVNSGTSALHAALVASGVKGGEVIMPALCPAMDAFAIIHAGARPVFADVDPLTHLVTHETIARCVTGNTRACIVVDLHGLPVDIDPILFLGGQHNFVVIEDCAQALLARYKNGFAGTKADFGCFSFEKKKHMTTGSEGGMIITNSAALATAARKFAGIGYKHMTADAGRTSLNASVYQRPDYARFDTIGLNYRMSETQAKDGMAVLPVVLDRIKQRQDIGAIWQDAIGEQCQPHNYDADNVFYSAAFPYKGNWLDLYNRFTFAGGDGFYAMPLLPYYEPALKNTALHYEMDTTAYHLQRQLVLLKTHYASPTMAALQASIFKEVL